jgi:uncharacterized membrane protein YdjX (TVP38/TMEM64 family)
MDALLRFFNRMDSKAARAVWITLVLFALVAGVFLVGRFVLDIEPNSVQSWFATAAESWYALPVTILVFTVLAFFGVPQFALIAAAVFAFGPVEGFLYSWVATMVSATVDFWLARIAGAKAIKRYGGKTVNRISAFVGRNGFFASMIVRIVPSAPFIVVNMAAGISRMSYFAFIAGAGVGVIPKTAVIAFFGGSLMALIAGGGWQAWAALGAALIAWIGLMLFSRRLLRADSGPAVPENEHLAEPEASDRVAKPGAPSHNEHSHS